MFIILTLTRALDHFSQTEWIRRERCFTNVLIENNNLGVEKTQY